MTDITTNYCTHTTNGSVCAACLGGIKVLGIDYGVEGGDYSATMHDEPKRKQCMDEGQYFTHMSDCTYQCCGFSGVYKDCIGRVNLCDCEAGKMTALENALTEEVKCGGLHPQPYVDPALIARCQPFADLIRKARKDAGLDLLQLANALGWSTPMLSAVERARQAPPSLGNERHERFAPWVGIMFSMIHCRPDVFEQLAFQATEESLYWCEEEQHIKVIREDADFCPSCGVSGESLYPWSYIGDAIYKAMIAKDKRTSWEKTWPSHCRACLGSGLTEGIDCPWCRAKGRQVCPRCAHAAQPWGYGACGECGWTTTADFLPPLNDEQRTACLGNVRLFPQ